MTSRVVPACGETIATFAARELIHQRRLADIRRSGDRDDETIAKPLAPPLPGQDFFDLGQQRFDLRQGRRDQFRRHVALVRKSIPASIKATLR
jgi:hypothetical protein